MINWKDVSITDEFGQVIEHWERIRVLWRLRKGAWDFAFIMKSEESIATIDWTGFPEE